MTILKMFLHEVFFNNKLMFDFLNPIKIIVFITFLFGLFYLNKQKSENKMLFYILLVYLLTEIFAIYFSIYQYNLGFFYNISMAFQFLLWIILLLSVFKKQKLFVLLTFIILIAFSFINNYLDFNKTNFLIGSFMYLIIYIYNVFRLLKSEEIEFFQSSQFILISSPILFFLGMSLMYAFTLDTIRSTLVFGDIELYKLVNYFINIIFYLLINVYIFKERKLNA